MPGFNIPITQPACNDGYNGQSAYAGPDPNIEYARKNRWLLELMEPFGSLNDGILLYAHKCARPTPEIDEIKIHHGQDEIYRPGKNRWGPIDITFYEKTKSGGRNLVDDSAQRIYDWWAKNLILLESSRHGQVYSYYKTGNLQMLDGDGRAIWQYRLYECWPYKITPSDLDYSDSNIAEITVTLRFNKAKEIPGD